jgi:cobalt-zinc-cadmium efflux system outer membrane protein
VKRMLSVLISSLVTWAIAASPAPATPAAGVEVPVATPAPADRLVAAVDEAGLRELIGEVLDRSPELASLAASADAAADRAPQVKALPDPVAGVTTYLSTPETRVGPQQAMVSLSQRFPWFGKLDLRERAALYEAAEARSKVEAARLRLVTETRRLYCELGFLGSYRQVVTQDRDTLSHYEEVARMRYASGVGVEQSVIKIQAEISKDDARLIDIATRRADLLAQLNALRDRPDDTPLPAAETPRYPALRPSLGTLRSDALNARPEVAAAQAAIDRAEVLTELARKDYKPDVTLGLSYVLVGKRTDAQGEAMPPPDNGKDVFAVSASLNLPIRHERLAAGVAEAAAAKLAAEQSKRAVLSAIDRSLGDLAERVPLTWERLRLFTDVLTVQAEQSLRSAEIGYAAGTLHALDLLDAERTLLEVRTAAARARADYAIAVAQLEGAAGSPLVAAATGVS